MNDADSASELENCPDCAAKPHQHHFDGCDWALCPDCGAQLLLHDCDQWPQTADGPDRPAIWYGIDPRAEVARVRDWWVEEDGDRVEDFTRVLIAVLKKQIVWNPREQRYDIGAIDEDVIDQVLARSR